MIPNRTKDSLLEHMKKVLFPKLDRKEYKLSNNDRKQIKEVFTKTDKPMVFFKPAKETTIMENLAKMKANPELAQASSQSRVRKKKPESFSDEWLRKLQAGGIDGLEVKSHFTSNYFPSHNLIYTAFILNFHFFQIRDTDEMSKVDPTVQPMGKGVFTTRLFEKYDFITEYKGQLLSNEDGWNKYQSSDSCTYFTLGPRHDNKWYVVIIQLIYSLLSIKAFH